MMQAEPSHASKEEGSLNDERRGCPKASGKEMPRIDTRTFQRWNLLSRSKRQVTENKIITAQCIRLQWQCHRPVSAYLPVNKRESTVGVIELGEQVLKVRWCVLAILISMMMVVIGMVTYCMMMIMVVMLMLDDIMPQQDCQSNEHHHQ